MRCAEDVCLCCVCCLRDSAEFIAHNASIHFEAMGESQFWIGIEIDGRIWHINCGAINPNAKGYARCEEDT